MGWPDWSGWDAAGLEVSGGVEGELAEELAGVPVDDLDVQVVDEEGDRGAGVQAADADVVHPTAVPQGDRAGLVDLVVAHAPVRVEVGTGGGGLGAGGVGLPRGPAVEGSVGSDRVVVAAEPGQLAL